VTVADRNPMAYPSAMRRRTFISGVTACLLVLALAGSLNAAVVVRAVFTESGYRFRPKVLEVAPGTRVTWRAVAGSHTVTATSKNWSKDDPLQIGLPTSFTFRSAGTFRYRCKIHSTIVEGRCEGHCGKVVVG
jgi:plastocyanin